MSQVDVASHEVKLNDQLPNLFGFMDFDLQRVKEYDLMIQLLVFGYGREICDDLPELIPWLTLSYYHEGEKFDEFDPSSYSIDSTKRIITKKAGDNMRGCYGGRPILCDGINREVHEFELQWVKGESNITIGIDEGRTNTKKDLWNGYSSNHYLLNNFGSLWTKGIVHVVLPMLRI